METKDVKHFPKKETISLCSYENFDDNGTIRRRVKFSSRSVDEPFTPQSGIETCMQDLNFIVGKGLRIPDDDVRLSLTMSSNPFATASAIKSIINVSEKKIDNYNIKEN